MTMKRVGLFVGIDKYKNGISQLQCAVNDAKELSYAFNRTGYSVKLLTNEDCDSNRIAQEMESMLDGLQTGDIFVFYFSGHGRELNGAHSLVCVNSYPQNNMYDADAFPLARLMALTDNISGLNRFFILDCCRSNILADKAGTYVCSNSRDIALETAVEQSQGRKSNPPLIVNSCSTGEQAFEDEKTRHGFFTKALLRVLADGKIRNFYQFQKELKISGTPRPQNISWCGNINSWDHIPLFKDWEDGPLSEDDKRRAAELEINSLKDELKGLGEKSCGKCSREVERWLQSAKLAEEKKDYVLAIKFLKDAIDQHIAAEKKAAAER